FRVGQSAALLTTLPFGLRAILELRPRATGARSADTVVRNEPTFVRPDLRGGAQIAFIAESGPSRRDDIQRSSGIESYSVPKLDRGSVKIAGIIDLPANTLVVDSATGGFRLRDSVNIGAPRPPLIVAQRGSDVMQVDYSGATLSYSFSQTNWSMEMPGIEMWTDCLGVTKVAGLRSHLVAGTTARPVVRDVAMLLKHEIEAALTFLTGFGSRPQMGPMDLGASNTVTEHKFTLAVDKSWEFPNAPGGRFIYVK